MHRQRKTKNAPMEEAMSMTEYQESTTDPQGSYTGVPAVADEVPVQDADDL